MSLKTRGSAMTNRAFGAVPLLLLASIVSAQQPSAEDTVFFERHIRPILVKNCYECHSEQAQEQQGGLILDRRTGWMKGGDTDKAIVPGDPEGSLLIKAVRYDNDDLQMPPEEQLAATDIKLLEQWVRRGAPGPKVDLGETEFSRLGDQEYLFSKAEHHWAFRPVRPAEPPRASDAAWNRSPIDRFVYAGLTRHRLTPSRPADPRTLIRRMSFDLTGLPPSPEQVERFVDEAGQDYDRAIEQAMNRLLASPAFGEHIARMWLDVARYADTDSFYRPDTRTPHYFPFCVHVPRLRDRGVQRRQAVRPVCAGTTGGGPAGLGARCQGTCRARFPHGRSARQSKFQRGTR